MEDSMVQDDTQDTVESRILALKQAMEFSDEELDANRHGRLAISQMRRLFLWDLLLMPLVITALYGLAFSCIIPLRTGAGFPVLQLLVFTFALVLFVTFLTKGALVVDMIRRDVLRARGTLTLTSQIDPRSVTSYYCYVGPLKLVVPRKESYDAMDHAINIGGLREFIVYYTPMTRRVLSVEPVT
jgi:hypothetical protein